MVHNLRDTTAWADFSRQELERKRNALHGLLESGNLSERSAEQQRLEIDLIDRELARREAE